MYILYNVNLYVLFAIFWFIFYFPLFFHIDIVYECIVLCCIFENKLTYLLTVIIETVTLVEVDVLTDRDYRDCHACGG